MFVISIYSSKWDWKNPFVENEQEKVGTTIFPQQVYWDQFHLQFLFPNHPERGNKVNLHFSGNQPLLGSAEFSMLPLLSKHEMSLVLKHKVQF